MNKEGCSLLQPGACRELPYMGITVLLGGNPEHLGFMTGLLGGRHAQANCLEFSLLNNAQT